MNAISAGRGTRADALDARFRLHRAGILNVWQYDEQVFSFAGGRLLLRGANGAGKSKTLEMLLPFALDGDKARITASAKHHTSLLWLMTDGIDGGNRVGYVWVEFRRITGDGRDETFTCGVGIRASSSARQATAWHFVTTDRRVGIDFSLEDDAGPLSLARLKDQLGAENVFEKAADYKAHVGRSLFGLDPRQYDEVLRLLYRLRQPQVGEDIEPVKLAEQLSLSLPQLDDVAVRSAGETFDELTAFGEQIERRAAAADDLASLAAAYSSYARAVIAKRARAAAEALRAERIMRAAVRSTSARQAELETATSAAMRARDNAQLQVEEDRARLDALEDSPEFRDQRRLNELGDAAEREAALAREATDRRSRQQSAVERLMRLADAKGETARHGLAQHVTRLIALDERQRRWVPGTSVPVPSVISAGHGLGDVAVEVVTKLLPALDHVLGSLAAARSTLSRRRAGIDVVRQSVRVCEKAEAAQRAAEREADTAEGRWEEARESRHEAQQAEESELRSFQAAIDAWASMPASPGIDLPSEVTEYVVAGLPRVARDAAAPRLGALREDLTRHRMSLASATAALEKLAVDRAAAAAERDPAPPPPPLPRTARPDGHALWQVVDYALDIPQDARAGAEAALQGAGLLDAWVRPGGRLLDHDELDIVLAAGQDVEGQTSLDAILVPDVPHGSAVSAADVSAVLSGIAVAEQSTPMAAAAVSLDGRWRLGPASGRAFKERAQYIGATARASERARRLALIDAAMAESREVAQDAERECTTLLGSIAELEAWVAAAPSGRALSQSRTLTRERRLSEEREDQRNRSAQAAANQARVVATDSRSALLRVAAEQELPADMEGLRAVELQLTHLAEEVKDAERGDRELRIHLQGWLDAAADCESNRTSLNLETTLATAAAERAAVAAAKFEALRASVGDSLRQLQQRIAEARQSQAGHKAAVDAAARRVEELLEEVGQSRNAVLNAEQRLSDHRPQQEVALADLLDATRIPGLVDAAGLDAEQARAVESLDGYTWGEPTPRSTFETVQALGGGNVDESTLSGTQVWRAYSDATSGPAADHQPALATFDSGLITVTGRDDAGEAAIVPLARRVRAAVGRDRDLLTDREKRQFEKHILGELGDAIGKRRREAEELVVSMNEQLGHVTTSQGVRVRLDWKLRDEVPQDVKTAVRLLAQPVDALIPEEREKLRDVLHQLIRASRAEHPEFSYGEHLAAALDYRTWSEFSIRYTRPEKAGQWERLHRRSPLSQGEQKVLCYLPLFAAAAAHFTSLAGAAPHAPRLVLLDDAFPKIDVRTHPLLFGLLVQLDLDFVVTSERLWGDHSTVPSLAIYEALRDPNHRGIAQYEYRWNGRTLESLG